MRKEGGGQYTTTSRQNGTRDRTDSRGQTTRGIGLDRGQTTGLQRHIVTCKRIVTAGRRGPEVLQMEVYRDVRQNDPSRETERYQGK